MDRGLAVGIDLVEVERFAAALRRTPRLAARLFTEQERAVAGPSERRTAERLAARFAAKEAAFKALGDGWPRLHYHEVELLTSPNGAPQLRLSGRAADLASEADAKVSLSHAGGLAAAFVALVPRSP